MCSEIVFQVHKPDGAEGHSHEPRLRSMSLKRSSQQQPCDCAINVMMFGAIPCLEGRFITSDGRNLDNSEETRILTEM